MFELVGVFTAKTKAIGVGGAGGNVINAIVRAGIKGVECISANTDKSALGNSLSPLKIQLGSELTRGLGAGADPDVGRLAALETKETLKETLKGTDVVFIFAGLGGGTGTGGAPVIANILKEIGAFVVGIVTLPFEQEGKVRNEQAQHGLAEMKESVDTLLVIKNQRLLDINGGKLSVLDAFQKINDVICNTAQGLADLLNTPGLINVDFADVKKILSGKGKALIRTGCASGENRVAEAINNALNSEVFEENSLEGAHGVLVNISGSAGIEVREIQQALSLIKQHVHEDANIIMGTMFDENIADEFRITLIASDFDAHQKKTTPLEPAKNIDNNHLLQARYPITDKEALDIPAYLRRQENSRIISKLGIISDDGELQD